LTCLQGLNFLSVQTNFGDYVLHKFHQKFDLETSHYSQNAVRIYAKFVLRCELVVGKFFGNASAVLIFLGNNVVENWHAKSAHTLLVVGAQHFCTLNVDNILTLVDNSTVLNNAVGYRNFAPYNEIKFRHRSQIRVDQLTIGSRCDYQECLLKKLVAEYSSDLF